MSVLSPGSGSCCPPSPHPNNSEVRLVLRFQRLHWGRQAGSCQEAGLVDCCSLGHCCWVRQLVVCLVWCRWGAGGLQQFGSVQGVQPVPVVFRTLGRVRDGHSNR